MARRQREDTVLNSDMNILVGDIGGTNARFARTNASGELQKVFVIKTEHFIRFSELLFAACKELALDASAIDCAAVAIAGPCDGTSFQLTNAALHGSVGELEAIAQCAYLLNDFEALAWGVLEDQKRPYLVQNILHHASQERRTPKEEARTRTNVVIGPGTGLGLAHVVTRGDGVTIVLPGEGGHTAFAAESEVEWQLAQRLCAREGRNWVSVEHFLSGRGLESIDALLHGGARTAIEVVAAAPADATARESVACFLRILGHAARDAALRVNAEKVYVAGGMTPKLLSVVEPEVLIEAFLDQPSWKERIAATQLTLLTDAHPGLKGAAAFAMHSERRS